MSKVLAVIGCGRIANIAHFPALSQIEGVRVKYACDIILEKAEKAKQEYDKIADALSQVKATGYGVVMPKAEEMVLEKPEIIKKGGSFGVKLKAGAPSIHMIRVDIDT